MSGETGLRSRSNGPPGAACTSKNATRLMTSSNGASPSIRLTKYMGMPAWNHKPAELVSRLLLIHGHRSLCPVLYSPDILQRMLVQDVRVNPANLIVSEKRKPGVEIKR